MPTSHQTSDFDTSHTSFYEYLEQVGPWRSQAVIFEQPFCHHQTADPYDFVISHQPGPHNASQQVVEWPNLGYGTTPESHPTKPSWSGIPSRPPDKRFKLSALPRELRDVIYELALSHDGAFDLSTFNIPAICAMNQQYRDEALHLFYQLNEFKSHVHMPHSYHEALSPRDYHEVYDCARLCTDTIDNLTLDEHRSFAIMKIKFDIYDIDSLHFATIQVIISKRDGPVVICQQGPADLLVAPTEVTMLKEMGRVLMPTLVDMTAKPAFRGLRLKHLKKLVKMIVIPYTPDMDNEDEGIVV